MPSLYEDKYDCEMMAVQEIIHRFHVSFLPSENPCHSSHCWKSRQTNKRTARAACEFHERIMVVPLPLKLDGCILTPRLVFPFKIGIVAKLV